MSIYNYYLLNINVNEPYKRMLKKRNKEMDDQRKYDLLKRVQERQFQRNVINTK